MPALPRSAGQPKGRGPTAPVAGDAALGMAERVRTLQEAVQHETRLADRMAGAPVTALERADRALGQALGVLQRLADAAQNHG